MRVKEKDNLSIAHFFWFAKWNDFRTMDWDTKLRYPELVMKTTEKLLSIVDLHIT